jgi:hypothetical protein
MFMKADAPKWTKAQKWILILGFGGLLLGAFRVLLERMQPDWTVRIADTKFGIHVIKSFVFLVLGNSRVDISGLLDYPSLLMPAIGLAVAAGVWISRKSRHAGV